MSSFHRRQHAHNAGFLVAGNRTDDGVATFAATAKMGLTTAPATTFIYPWCRSGHGLLGGFVLVPPWSGLCTCPAWERRWACDVRSARGLTTGGLRRNPHSAAGNVGHTGRWGPAAARDAALGRSRSLDAQPTADQRGGAVRARTARRSEDMDRSVIVVCRRTGWRCDEQSVRLVDVAGQAVGRVTG